MKYNIHFEIKGDEVKSFTYGEAKVTPLEFKDLVDIDLLEYLNIILERAELQKLNPETIILNESEIIGLDTINHHLLNDLKSNSALPHSFDLFESVYRFSDLTDVLIHNRVITDSDFIKRIYKLKGNYVDHSIRYSGYNESFTLSETAKLIDVCGRNTLIQILKAENIIDKHNIALQRYVDEEYFKIVANKSPYGWKTITRVTHKGLEFIKNRLIESNFKSYGKE